MKHTRIILLFLIILFLIIGGTFQHMYFHSVSAKLLPLAQKISDDILLHNWDHTKEDLLKLQSLWRRHHNTLSAMTEHELVTNISISLAELCTDLAAENYQQLPAEAARLTEHIRLISKTERITLANIF